VKPLIAVKFGDSDKLRLGEWVIADRQPVQSRRLGHGRHRLGAQPRHQPGALRQLHPDRRLDQSRQFRRTAVQPRGRSRRRQHADHLADRRLDRSWFRRALQDGGPVWSISSASSASFAAAGSVSASSRSPTRSPKASTSSPRAARWLPASMTRGRQSRRASSLATSSSSSTARTSRIQRISSRVVADTAVGKDVEGYHHPQGQRGNQEGHARPPRGHRKGAAGPPPRPRKSPPKSR